MPGSNRGELKKMKLEAYTDEDFSSSAGKFILMFNPSSYDRKLSVKRINKNKASGTSRPSQKFSEIAAETCDFEFILDGTGAAATQSRGKKIDVYEKIQEFRKLAALYDGDIHSPRYIKLSWGAFIFKCVLKDYNITYTLFKPDGSPLRAKIKATFTGFKSAKLQAAEDGENSPDLTHYRVVIQGDSLPLMTHRIYGDTQYYSKVAQYNGLKNFRKLTPGMRIAFPPLKDLENLKN